MEKLEESVIKQHLLIYNAKTDLVNYIMDNIVSKQLPEDLNVMIFDDTINQYEIYNEHPNLTILIKDNNKVLGMLRLV